MSWLKDQPFRSSQATSRTKFKDDMWLEACSECCGKNLPFQKLVFVFLFVHFPQVIYSISSSAAIQSWGRIILPKGLRPLWKSNLSPQPAPFIISRPKESLMQRSRCNIHPRSIKKQRMGRCWLVWCCKNLRPTAVYRCPCFA